LSTNVYRFFDTWTVPAPKDEVWEVLARAELLPVWWKGVFLESQPIGDPEPHVGGQARVVVRGFLPYKLNFIAEATALERGHLVEVTTRGDFEGVWRMVLSTAGEDTRVDIEWTVTVHKPIVRSLSPVLKPLFRRNHDWSSERGQAGLRDYFSTRGVSERTSSKLAAS
jgi:uncharacterized protein YndB with AHSA1/START domain